MSGVFDLTFLQHIKVLIVAILIYAVIFAMLKKIQVFGDDNKINSLIALLAAVIVSFSGVVTYAVSYAINWFVIIFFITFLVILFLLFFGVSMDTVTSQITSNGRVVVGVLGIFFFVILIKGFFALNNAYDVNEPIDDPYEVDPSFNTGVDDVTNSEVEGNIFDFIFGFFSGINSEFVSLAMFFLILGIFVVFLGR